MLPSPSVEIVSPENDSVMTSSEVVVTWESQNAVRTEVSMDGVTWEEVDGDSYEMTLANGSHVVHVRVTEEFGKMKQSSVAFTVDIPSQSSEVDDQTPTPKGGSDDPLVIWIGVAVAAVAIVGIAGAVMLKRRR